MDQTVLLGRPSTRMLWVALSWVYTVSNLRLAMKVIMLRYMVDRR